MKQTTDPAKIAGFHFNNDCLEKDLKNSLERIHWRDHIKSDSILFVKPNYTAPFFVPGITTNRCVIEALLGILKDRAAEVYIGESDGGDESFTAEYSLNNHGVPDICRKTGATMINLSQTKRVRVTDTICGRKTDVTLPVPLLTIDESISVPVLKVHVMTKITLSLKNLWGCHPSTLRLMDHKYLSERLTLIAKSINLRYVVVDAIYGLNRHGPMDGDAVDIGAIIVGNNPVATDATGTRLMGFDPKTVHHIMIAHKYGLGPVDEREINILDDLTPYQQHFYVQRNILDQFSALTFKSNILNKFVSDSVFSKYLYKIANREYRKKIVNPGDEK
jgi:uncharacterized protein (DUF362 family)